MKRLVALGLLSLYSTAYPWGDTGHRAVGRIADKNLSDKARSVIGALLGNETLAEAAAWADEMRSEPAYKFRDPYHFVEVHDGPGYDPAKASPHGDLVKGIEEMQATLRDEKAPNEKRVEAVRYLVHFIGDIHQPLHVGNGLDMGANLCEVYYLKDRVDTHVATKEIAVVTPPEQKDAEGKFSADQVKFLYTVITDKIDEFKKRFEIKVEVDQFTNLHSVIDDKIIDSTHLSFTELADFSETASKEEINAWTARSVNQWVEEAVPLREMLYPKQINNSVDPMVKGSRNYCRKDWGDKIHPDLRPNLSFAYRHQVLPILQKQIAKAGYRAAATFNEIFK